MTTNSIPASLFLQVTPSVLAAAGSSLGMNAVLLDNNSAIPIGTLMGFGNEAEVAAFFGAASLEATLAGIYFGGFNGCTQLPSAIYFAQYNTSAVSAYIRGAALTGITLSQLQLYSGDIVIEIDGRQVTSGSINLSSATSFSSAAALVQAGLQSTGSVFSGTGSVTSTSEVLTITAVSSGALHVGDVVVGTNIPSGTTIASFGTGTGGTGTYNMSQAASASGSGETITVTSAATCTYDSVRNAFVITGSKTGTAGSIAYPTDTSLSPSLLLTQAAGAVLSQGAGAAVPATFMTALTSVSQDWATFMSTFDPDNGAPGGPIKQTFSQWNAEQNDYYMYVAWDTDATPGTTLPDAACFAQQVASISGTYPVWDLNATQAASVAALACGITASIQFDAAGGSTAFAFRGSPVLSPDITSPTTFMNVTGTPSVRGNGYNTYAAVATRTQNFQWMQLGTVTGPFAFAQQYVNQIYWNSKFQADFATYVSTVKAIPYTPSGYAGIHQALASDIQAMGEFGGWVAGVELSSAQQQAVNTMAGIAIAPVLQSQGWYLLVDDPGASARAAGQSPIVQFYYCGGGSVGQINMSSVNVQ